MSYIPVVMTVAVVVALLISACMLPVSLLLVMRSMERRLQDRVESLKEEWLLPRGDKPSAFGDLVGVWADIAAERFYLRLKTSMMGEKSAEAKAARRGAPDPMTGMLGNPVVQHFIGKFLGSQSGQIPMIDGLNGNTGNSDYGQALSRWSK